MKSIFSRWHPISWTGDSEPPKEILFSMAAYRTNFGSSAHEGKYPPGARSSLSSLRRRTSYVPAQFWASWVTAVHVIEMLSDHAQNTILQVYTLIV